VVDEGQRHIVVLSGGLRRDEAGAYESSGLTAYMLGLVTTRSRPRICLIQTANGDNANAYLNWYSAFAGRDVETSHLALFPMPSVADPRKLLLEQDVILVGGGSVANLAAVWRVHGLDVILREAWEAGVILAGGSAGAICWFEGGTTDSYGLELRPFREGLGLLPGTYTPHYDSESRRRPTYQRLVGDGTLAAGWASDDGTAMHFVGSELVDVVTERPDATAWRVDPAPGGGVTEVRLDARLI